jgi:hypothetical protein
MRTSLSPTYLLALWLLIPSTLYTTAWFVMDVLARLGWWPNDLISFDIYAFVANTTAIEEAHFFAYVAFKLAALGLLLRRLRLAVPVFIVSYVLKLVDWISMAMNQYYNSSVDGSIQALVQLIILALLVKLYFDRGFVDSEPVSA